MASIVTTAYQRSVDVHVTGFESKYVTVTYYLHAGTNYGSTGYLQRQKVSSTSSTAATSFTGLSMGSQYTITATVYEVDTDLFLYQGNKTFTTTTSGTAISKPAKWTWSSAVGQGKPVNGVTWDEWNAYIARVQQWIEYKGKTVVSVSGNPTGSSASVLGEYIKEALMTETDRVLTAKRYNTAYYAINLLGGVYYGPVATGDQVMATFFTNRLTEINYLS